MHLYNTDACSCLSMNYIVFVCVEIDMDVHGDTERSCVTYGIVIMILKGRL